MLSLVIVLCCLYLYLGKNILVTKEYTMKSADKPEAFAGYKVLQIPDFYYPLYFEVYANWGRPGINRLCPGGMSFPEYSLWTQYYAGDCHMDDKLMLLVN